MSFIRKEHFGQKPVFSFKHPINENTPPPPSVVCLHLFSCYLNFVWVEVNQCVKSGVKRSQRCPNRTERRVVKVVSSLTLPLTAAMF
ncbi:unnamed protein product [Pieris brassicae]|uniref:Uncharacterized protein n=1 Tax=Pieris brassicae TaxID=7116 RepID=A0A9P0X127_PIEBR|nr:unnamed protein product [Pieris brassicae]